MYGSRSSGSIQAAWDSFPDRFVTNYLAVNKCGRHLRHAEDIDTLKVCIVAVSDDPAISHTLHDAGSGRTRTALHPCKAEQKSLQWRRQECKGPPGQELEDHAKQIFRGLVTWTTGPRRQTTEKNMSVEVSRKESRCCKMQNLHCLWQQWRCYPRMDASSCEGSSC